MAVQPDAELASERRRRPGRPRHDTPSREYLARKELIVRQAAIIFNAKGYETATLEDVAEALDMRKASLYYYYPSKMALVAELFMRAFEAGLHRLEEAATIQDPRVRLAAIIKIYVDEMADHPSLVAAFSGRRPLFNDHRDDEFEARDQRMISILADAVRDAVAAEVLPPIEIRYGAMALMGMLAFVSRWVDSRADDPLAIADTFVRLLALDRAAG